MTGGAPKRGSNARRLRRSRARWAHLKYRSWTAEDDASLMLHYDLLGPRWQLIAGSMQRSPDSLRNRLVRLGVIVVTPTERIAREWLRTLVAALNLEPPAEWSHMHIARRRAEKRALALAGAA